MKIKRNQHGKDRAKGDAMRIFIVRHGESYSNVQGRVISTTDLPLTERGIKQSKATHAYLKKIIYPDAVHHVFSSPLMRAKQTAAIVCGPDMIITECDDLREMNLGLLEGLTWDERFAGYPEINIENALSEAVLPDGEKYCDIKLRCVNFIRGNIGIRIRGVNGNSVVEVSKEIDEQIIIALKDAVN